jgi:hypothetical protein
MGAGYQLTEKGRAYQTESEEAHDTTPATRTNGESGQHNSTGRGGWRLTEKGEAYLRQKQQRAEVHHAD